MLDQEVRLYFLADTMSYQAGLDDLFEAILISDAKAPDLLPSVLYDPYQACVDRMWVVPFIWVSFIHCSRNECDALMCPLMSWRFLWSFGFRGCRRRLLCGYGSAGAVAQLG